MSVDIEESLREFERYYEKMKKDMPEITKAYTEITKAMYKEGTLKPKEKELISLGIAIYARCEQCIALHVRRALNVGATKEEIMSVCAVAISMGGGPALVYIPLVLRSIEKLSKREAGTL